MSTTTPSEVCPCCGFDLRALSSPADRCPECGADAAMRVVRPRYLLMLAGIPLVAFVFEWMLTWIWGARLLALNPGNPSRGISPMGPETTERYVLSGGFVWSLALPVVLALVTAIAVIRIRGATSVVCRTALVAASGLAWITLLASTVADGTTSSPTTAIMSVGNVLLRAQLAWMTLAVVTPLAMLAPQRLMRALAWVCVAIAIFEALVEIRYYLHVPLLSKMGYNASTQLEWITAWACRVSAGLLVGWVFVSAWLMPDDGKGNRWRPAPRLLRWCTVLGWVLVVIMPVMWWSVRAPLAGLGYPASTWILLVSRWTLTLLVGAMWVLPVLALDDRRLRRAWIAAACAAMASVILLAGRDAPKGSTFPWTLPESQYPGDEDPVAGEGEGDTENPPDATNEIDAKLYK